MNTPRSAVPPPERVAAVARVRREITRAVDRECVICRGEGVVVACSGGVDSLTLLDALVRLAPPRGWRLVVAHVDHQLRPDSWADGDVVERVAAERGHACERLRVAVARDGSLQDAARRARYGALEELADRYGCSAIALGHTADDQAETVLMRALAGATPRALAAMRPRRGRLARPLLRLWRAATVAYCDATGLPAIDDPSNRDPQFLRTRVRRELIPALEAYFPGARRRLVALARHQQALLDRCEGS